jgi:hypothetical protein
MTLGRGIILNNLYMAKFYEYDRTVFFPGKLGLPIVKLESKFTHNFSAKLFNEYSDCIEKTTLGQKVLADLEIDPRVLHLKDEMISRGSGSYAFEVKNLAQWFLWHANNVGLDVAKSDLELFLNSDEISVINSLWITGIEVGEEIKLEDGISIKPAKDMPDSLEKEIFLQHEFYSTGLRTLKPTCAITKSVTIPKIASNDFSVFSSPKDHVFWTSRSRFDEIALLLNIFPNVTCLPYYSTGHVAASTPMGPFGGTGGGSPIYDIQAKHNVKFTSESVTELNVLLNSFNSMDEKSKMRIRTAINRLSQAKRSIQIDDQILDISISIEMLLLDRKRKQTQIAKKFKCRGSWLLSTPEIDRVEIEKKLEAIYDYRSDAAHSGILCKGNAIKIAEVRNFLPKYQTVAEDICKKIILNGFPNWSTVNAEQI